MLTTEFSMPAEHALHECTWMAWPSSAKSSKKVWKVPGFDRVLDNVAHVIRAIALFEPVKIIINNESDIQTANDHIFVEPLPKYAISYHICTTDDNVWVRDIGPTFTLSHDHSQLCGVCWVFNSWGQKFKPWNNDAKVGKSISELADVGVVYKSTLTVEGGSIHCDGEGTILITETSVLNKNRNPKWTKQAVEEELKRTLGAQAVVWLPGLSAKFDPITDGHVDGIACFARPGVVLFSACTPLEKGAQKSDREYAKAVARNRRALEVATDAQGRHFTIIDLPECSEVLDSPLALRACGEFCNSYLNFYLTNGGGLIAPAFGCPADVTAGEILRESFPGREVVMVDITGVACGGGGIHCITQQQPDLASVSSVSVSSEPISAAEKKAAFDRKEETTTGDKKCTISSAKVMVEDDMGSISEQK